MSYGLNLGWGRTYRGYIGGYTEGLYGDLSKGYTIKFSPGLIYGSVIGVIKGDTRSLGPKP